MRDVLAAVHLDRWVLPALLVWPTVGSMLIFMFGRTPLPGREPGFAAWRDVRALTMLTLIGEAILALGLWGIYVPGGATWQATVDLPWIPDWGARVTLGVDGISLVMIVMTAIVMPLAVYGSWSNVTSKVRSYYGLLLILMSGMMGVFVSLDLLLFYVFWELVLIPTYFMIGVAGGARRSRASLKYFLMVFVGSLLMLVAIVALWVAGGARSFNVDTLVAASRTSLSTTGQISLFAGFFLAFAVKSGLFPFHTWLPDAQHEAPTSAAVALGVKVGTYGLLRFALPLFPAAVLHPTLRMVIVAVAVIGVLYGALVAMVQPDFKKLVSYASVSHLGFVMLGIFALTVQSIQGAMMVMLNHGISIGAMFLLVGMLHDRRKTGLIRNFGGIARVIPVFAAMLTLVSLSTIGLPGTNGFIGEFLVLLGAYRSYPVAAVIATTGVVLAAVYLLWALQRVIFNPLDNAENAALKDLDRRELAVMVVFAVIIVWLGVAPGPVLRRIEGPAGRIVEQVTRGAAVATAAPDVDVR
jgi:NADH-quinone oxidoreductase subunit M